jgi:hypothetical protein
MEYLYVKSVPCEHCGAKAPLIRRVMDFQRRRGEIRTFECIACRKNTEIKMD